MRTEDYSTAEELAEELEEMEYVKKVRVSHSHCVSFSVEEGVHIFDFPSHSGWFVDSMTHWEGDGIGFRMVFIV